jgi:succinate dehydrogenase / fumarate reductase, membrane anchor subunit
MSNNSTSLRSERSIVRSLGANRVSGTHHAWVLRITAAALMPLTIAFAFLVVSMVGRDHEALVRLFSHRVAPGTIALLFVLTGIYHMKTGMQTIIDDYAHGWWRPGLTVANILFAGLIAMATALSILKLAVGG